jgi:ATP-dependent Clp protease ATP-binding subunit ClpC
MFERYTEGARRTIFFARYEASRLGSPEIDTEHLMLGLLREDKTLIRQALLNVDYESAYRDITAGANPSESNPSTSIDLPF